MGVAGLLPVLKPASETVSLEKYRGKSLAIDTYSWLHKAVFCCADKIVMDMPTKAYWGYFNKKLKMLNHFGITPYFVLDGDYLPRKSLTESEREQRRDEHKQQALNAHDAGNSKLAFSSFQKACDVSPELAKSLIEEFKSRDIKYVVAPYEADSQMVMLEKLKLVDAIISEDSDLLVFGAQCLLTKLNDSGTCVEIRRDNFKKCQGSKISMFDDEQLLLMATISGCDYTKGIPRYGIQKAITQVYQYKTYERVILSIRAEGKPIPITFDDEYHKARIAFRHQIVFNPMSSAVEHLNSISEDIKTNYSEEYIYSCTGIILDPNIHIGVSRGDLNPHSKARLLTREEKFGFLDGVPLAQRSSTLPLGEKENNNQGFKRTNTMQSLTYRSSKPVPKQRRALINIMSFANKINEQKTTSIKAPMTLCKNNGNHPNPNKNLSPTSKRQKTFVFSNMDSKTPAESSKFFQSRLESATLSILNTKTPKRTVVRPDAPNIYSDVENDSKLNASIESTSQHLHEQTDDSLVEPQHSYSMNSRDTYDNEKECAMICPSDLVMTDIEDEEEDNFIPEFKSSTPTKKVKHRLLLGELKDLSESSSSTSDGDVGELNTAYYLNKQEPDDSLIEDESFEEPVNKTNMLDEIYSFKRIPKASTKPEFSPENFIYKMEKARRKPSPLKQRVPLGNISANISNNALKTATSSPSSSNLDRFRFVRADGRDK